MSITKLIIPHEAAVLSPAEPQLSPGWEPLSVGEWLDSVVDVPEWLLTGLLPADSVIILSGKAKLGFKSWFAFVQALSVASGKQIGPFIPANPAGLPVLILEADGGRAQTRNRWLWLAKSNGIDFAALPHLRFSHRENIVLDDEHSEWPGKVNECIKRLGVKLVIVDPLAMFFSGDENRVQDVARIMRTFSLFRESGASILFLHHLTKTDPKFSKDIDEEMRGSSALPGFYDLHQAMRRRTANQKHIDAIFRFKDDEQQFFELQWFIDKHQGLADFKMAPSTEEGTFARFADELTAHMVPNMEYSKARILEMAEFDETTGKDLIDYMLAEKLVEHGTEGIRLPKKEKRSGLVKFVGPVESKQGEVEHSHRSVGGLGGVRRLGVPFNGIKGLAEEAPSPQVVGSEPKSS